MHPQWTPTPLMAQRQRALANAVSVVPATDMAATVATAKTANPKPMTNKAAMPMRQKHRAAIQWRTKHLFRKPGPTFSKPHQHLQRSILQQRKRLLKWLRRHQHKCQRQPQRLLRCLSLCQHLRPSLHPHRCQHWLLSPHQLLRLLPQPQRLPPACPRCKVLSCQWKP